MVYHSDIISTRLNYTERNMVGSSRMRKRAKVKVQFFLFICLDKLFQIFRYPSAEMWRCIIMSREHSISRSTPSEVTNDLLRGKFLKP